MLPKLTSAARKLWYFFQVRFQSNIRSDLNILTRHIAGIILFFQKTYRFRSFKQFKFFLIIKISIKRMNFSTSIAVNSLALSYECLKWSLHLVACLQSHINFTCDHIMSFWISFKGLFNFIFYLSQLYSCTTIKMLYNTLTSVYRIIPIVCS